MREVIDEHHIDGCQNNLLIGEVDSKGEEEASDNEQGDSENQLTPQELLINFALTLDVEGNGTLEDLDLCLKLPDGTIVLEGISCDLNYML